MQREGSLAVDLFKKGIENISNTKSLQQIDEHVEIETRRLSVSSLPLNSQQKRYLTKLNASRDLMKLLAIQRQSQLIHNINRISLDALKLFIRNFCLIYNLRFGFSVLTRLIKLLRSKKSWSQVLTINEILDEKKLIFREDGVRLGLLVGGFTGIHRYLSKKNIFHLFLFFFYS